MAFLWPRVGEVDVDGVQEIVGYELVEKVAGVDENQPHVRAPVATDSIAGEAPVSSGTLDADKVHGGPVLRLLDEEGSLPGPNFHLHGMLVSEWTLTGDGLRQVSHF